MSKGAELNLTVLLNTDCSGFSHLERVWNIIVIKVRNPIILSNEESKVVTLASPSVDACQNIIFTIAESLFRTIHSMTHIGT